MKEYASHTSRQQLYRCLPLDTPFGIHICPTTYCNFKCVYCKHGSIESDKNFIKSFMDIDFFKMVIEQIKEFPHKLKLLNFAWLGEPLLHPQIAEMVAIAKKADIAERVEIVSNASLLTPDLSDALVNAGLDRIRISLQGLTEEDYYSVSKYKIDFSQLVDNIAYLYKKSREHGEKKTTIYIKIMDAMLKKEEDEMIFQKTFSNICDSFNIETLVPLVEENNISDLKKDYDIGYWKNAVRDVIVCPQPFYLLVITPEGIVLPCCEIGTHVNIGKISKNNTVVDIWNGSEMKNIRNIMLKGKRFEHPDCRRCNVVTYQTSEEDNLDAFMEELNEKYELENSNIKESAQSF